MANMFGLPEEDIYKKASKPYTGKLATGLQLDPAKAWAANPAAAKAYGIPQPTSYQPKPPQTYYSNIPTAAYEAQPDYAAYGQRKAEAEDVTRQLQAPPTQAYAPGKGYVPYQPGMTQSYQEQLDRVKALGEQYPWLQTPWQEGESVDKVAERYGQAATTKPYTPRAETQLKTTLKDYVSKAGDWLSNTMQGSIFSPKAAYAEGETPTQTGIKTLTGGEFTKAYGSTAGRSASTLYAQEVQMGVSDISASNLPDYFAVGADMEKQGKVEKGTTMERVVGGIQEGKITPENVSKAPEQQLGVNLSLVEHGEVRPEFYEAQNDTNLSQFAKEIGDNARYVPISDERLDAMEDEASIASLWDTGYKAPKVVNYISSVFEQFSNESSIPLWGADDPDKLKSIDYESLMNSGRELSEMSPNEMQKMVDNGTTMRLETRQTNKYDSFGNPVFTASWAKDVPYQPPQKSQAQSDTDYWNDWDIDVKRYWDSREVADRNKRREESWEWSHNKELEGWGEFYSALDVLKMTPFMNEWASSPAVFNELRRIWETTAKGQKWTDFLKGYDFMAKWFEQRPEARGEKPTAFSPMLTGASQL